MFLSYFEKNTEFLSSFLCYFLKNSKFGRTPEFREQGQLSKVPPQLGTPPPKGMAMYARNNKGCYNKIKFIDKQKNVFFL